MTWVEFEKRIGQSTEFREALEMQHFERNNTICTMNNYLMSS